MLYICANYTNVFKPTDVVIQRPIQTCFLLRIQPIHYEYYNKATEEKNKCAH